MKTLSGKKAVITGGSDGIGFGIAKALANNGADVLLIARDPDKLKRASAELARNGVAVKAISADLSDASAVEKISAQLLAEWSELSILVNNAGIARFTPFSEVTESEFDLHLNMNVKVPYLLTQRVLPALEKAKGSVINISSYFALRMLPGRPSSVYSMTKGAINSFTKALAFELGPRGVRVNAIAPGTVNTPLVQSNINRLSEEGKNKFYESIKTIYPLGRIGEPEDLGGIAVYLASDEAKWVTGSVISIDGGLTTS
ncbi:MAG: SDR family oxidoreductase [Deltaproteobacteria bacterium]|nr:SDR family oxidoreductase [Deltaproteobacteria bacterium]